MSVNRVETAPAFISRELDQTLAWDPVYNLTLAVGKDDIDFLQKFQNVLATIVEGEYDTATSVRPAKLAELGEYMAENKKSFIEYGTIDEVVDNPRNLPCFIDRAISWLRSCDGLSELVHVEYIPVDQINIMPDRFMAVAKYPKRLSSARALTPVVDVTEFFELQKRRAVSRGHLTLIRS